MRDVYQFIVVHLNEPVETQLEAVNDYMNDLTWIADSELWTQSDYWARPFETITAFEGDCEDIAIAKYLVLLLLGVPDEHLGFAHVITAKKEHQAKADQTHQADGAERSPIRQFTAMRNSQEDSYIFFHHSPDHSCQCFCGRCQSISALG